MVHMIYIVSTMIYVGLLVKVWFTLDLPNAGLLYAKWILYAAMC